MTTATLAVESEIDEDVVQHIPIHQIRPNPNQPRKHFDEDLLHALRVAIRSEGQLMPVFLKPVSGRLAEQDGIKYELIDGERRWRAALLEQSGITHLRAIVKDCDSKEQFLLSCAMNFNRAGHTAYEELLMVYQLVRIDGYYQNYVANILGKSVPWVNQRVLAHERLSQRVMEALKLDQIPISVATTLAKLTHTDQSIQLDNYLTGGTITTIQAAVQKASAEGNVQGKVRKPDSLDRRRLLVNMVNGLEQRLNKLESMGMTDIKRAYNMMESETKKDLRDSLAESLDRTTALLELLEEV